MLFGDDHNQLLGKYSWTPEDDNPRRNEASVFGYNVGPPNVMWTLISKPQELSL